MSDKKTHPQVHTETGFIFKKNCSSLIWLRNNSALWTSEFYYYLKSCKENFNLVTHSRQIKQNVKNLSQMWDLILERSPQEAAQDRTTSGHRSDLRTAHYQINTRCVSAALREYDPAFFQNKPKRTNCLSLCFHTYILHKNTQFNLLAELADETLALSCLIKDSVNQTIDTCVRNKISRTDMKI